MVETLIEVAIEVVVILGVFIVPALIWHRISTGSWNFIDPDLRD